MAAGRHCFASQSKSENEGDVRFRVLLGELL